MAKKPKTSEQPADPAVLGLLQDLAVNPRDVTALKILSDRLADLGPTPVRRDGRLPRWFLAALRVRQPCAAQAMRRCGQDYPPHVFRIGPDHWGRTRVCGLDAFVTEPYADMDVLAEDMVRAACRLALVPAVSPVADWFVGCVRGLLFNLQDLPPRPAPELRIVSLAEVKCRPPRWAGSFEDAFHDAYATVRWHPEGLWRRPVPDRLQDLVTREPRLAWLLDALAMWYEHRGRPWCRFGVWYGRGPWRGQGLKPLMSRLVGHFRQDDDDPELTSSEAYDTAYRYLYDTLPACRHKDYVCL